MARIIMDNLITWLIIYNTRTEYIILHYINEFLHFINNDKLFII